MKIKSIILLLIAASFSTIGNFLIKKASESPSLIKSIFEIKFVFGVFFYGLNLLVFLFVLKSENVSKAYPILATLSFILLTLLSYLYLDEKFSLINILGLIIIILGIYFLSK